MPAASVLGLGGNCEHLFYYFVIVAGRGIEIIKVERSAISRSEDWSQDVTVSISALEPFAFRSMIPTSAKDLIDSLMDRIADAISFRAAARNVAFMSVCRSRAVSYSFSATINIGAVGG